MATFSDRIKLLMKEKNLRQIDVLTLSEQYKEKYNIKFNKSHLSQYINGKFNPDKNKLFLLPKVFGVSEAWLLGYNVPRNPKKFKNSTVNSSKFNYNIDDKIINKVPAHISNIVDFDECDFPGYNNNEFFILKISDDSMEPRMQIDDIIVVKYQSQSINGDTLVVLLNNEYLTCKKIEMTKTGFILYSFNTKYPPIFFSNEETNSNNVVILGKVVELRRKY